MISSSVHRPPTPDSACEQDWAPCGRNETLTREGSASSSFSTSEDITSDLSEASSHSSSQRNLSEDRTSANGKPGMPLKISAVKGLPGQDSDVDSGIVTCRRHGQRIGSTSSADTDSSQDTTSRKSKYSSESSQEFPFWNNLKVQCRSKPSHSSGPVKADHTVLKECNRRPPTPLSILQDSLHQQVRFDDELHLSEQNIRRSCKKLFATLYAQRFSEPNKSFISRGRLSLPVTTTSQTFVRPRSHTLPECDLIPQRTVTLSVCPTSNSQPCGRSFEDKENRLNVRTTTNSLLREPSIRSSFPIRNEITQSGKSDTYKRLDRLDGAAKVSTIHSSRPKEHLCNTLSEHLSSPCNNSHHSSSSTQKYPSNKALFKSRSCSTLVSPQLTFDIPYSLVTDHRRCHPCVENSSSCLHKIPSCSYLCGCSGKCERNGQIPCQNSMIMAYAQLASVIPDEEDAAHNIGQTLHDKNYALKTVENCDQNAHLDNPELQKTCQDAMSEEGKSCPDSNSENHARRLNEKCVPSSDDNEHKSPLPGYQNDADCCKGNEDINSSSEISRSELYVSKQNSFSQKQLSLQAPVGNQMPSTSKNRETPTKHTEVEYAVIDKSKKSRYLSLPSLARVTSHTCIVEGSSDEQEPPVPPKKFMHKSDFALYSGNSSSRKSFFERVQGFTKSAKSALQKAFSTERIYRPEQEERLEATGQKLHRSKSFIKGLKMRMSTRHKKEKLKSTEIIHQTSFSPSWDENPSGSTSPTHVWGQLIQLNVDGSQVVELTKPTGKPYGFFVARGRVKNSKGVFVSRMRDSETQKLLAGLLDVGDEILEIDGASVKNADIMEVNNLMSNKSSLLLTVLPYICRKDI